MSFYAICKKHIADTWMWMKKKKSIHPLTLQETQINALITVSAAAQCNKRNIQPYSLVRLFQY